MMQVLMFIIMLFAAGCSTAPVRHTGGADWVQTNKVYSSIKNLLKHGSTVNIIVEYTSSFNGLPDGRSPRDYGYIDDSGTIIDTEKYFLLESFSKYPNFSIIDRSQMHASIDEMKLGSEGMAASSVQPGQLSGATYLIVMETKNIIRQSDGKVKDTYIEIKKLLDMQKNVVVAMDKYSETREVEYTPPGYPIIVQNVIEPQRQPQSTSSALPIMEGIPEPRQPDQPPPPVEPPQQKVETIVIHGNCPPQNPEVPAPAYTAQYAQERRVNTPAQRCESNKYDNKMPYWQFARMLKQRYPRLRDKDDKVVVQHFIRNHPRFNEKIRSPQEPGQK